MVGNFEKVPRTQPESTVKLMRVHKAVHPHFVDARLVTGHGRRGDKGSGSFEATTYTRALSLGWVNRLNSEAGKHKTQAGR
jgi:hypothetical protein